MRLTMKIVQPPSIARSPQRGACHRPLRHLVFKSLLLSCAILAILCAPPGGWTHPQQPVMIVPAPGMTLRDAGIATANQADALRRYASDWGRRAGLANYGNEHFQQDFGHAQAQFLQLRQQFNVLGNQALQVNQPRAGNAVAELDAALGVIGELFTFLQAEYNAGTLDPKTVTRTCRALEDAMGLWQREFKRSSPRIGLIW